IRMATLRRSRTSETSRLISLGVALAALIYAMYLGLRGSPFHSGFLPWPLGMTFSAMMAVFFIGAALRLQVVTVCALVLLGIGSAFSLTSYGLHFAMITLVLALLAVDWKPAPEA